jgi:hypothetical protein
MKDESDIRDVMRDEKNRLRPAGAEAKREHTKRLRQARKLLERATEEEFVTAMRSAGLRDGSDEFANALRIWRANRS